MNENEFDRTARAWLDDGPTQMSDRAVLSTLEEIHTTRQRRRWWPARRATPAHIFARMGATAAILVVGASLLTIIGSSVGGPSPSPSAAQALDFPDLTKTFVSPRNGFSIKHPEMAALTPAANLFDLGEGFDVVETGENAVFQGTSTKILDGTSIDGLVDDAVEDSPGGCGVPRSQPTEITIDGQSGRILECSNEIVALVIDGGRRYLFSLSHERPDARAIFDAFAATIDLTPETAVDVPQPDTTFVSQTNGFSFEYFDRGGLEPATELWDPVNQTALFVNGELDIDPFDYVDTGFGAAFMGASTVIPDGVSIDDWVDTSVAKYLPGGCSAPRGQQAEISIDGQSGRVTEDCPGKVVATVVVDGRLYLFMIFHNEDVDGRAFFDTFAATIDLTPETAGPSSTPSS